MSCLRAKHHSRFTWRCRMPKVMLSTHDFWHMCLTIIYAKLPKVFNQTRSVSQNIFTAITLQQSGCLRFMLHSSNRHDLKKVTMKKLLPTITLLIFLYLMGCTAHPAYSIGQILHEDQCNEIVVADGLIKERNRCVSTANKPYDEYKRQTDAATGK